MFDRVSDSAILMSVGSTIIFLADSNPQEQILSVTFVDFVKAGCSGSGKCNIIYRSEF